MNITLSAERTLVDRSRKYARQHGKTLNGMVRDYMESLVGGVDRDAAADEFSKLAVELAGRSDGGFRFDRESAHQRGEV